MGQTKCPSFQNLVIFNNEKPPNLSSGFVNPKAVQVNVKTKDDITCYKCGDFFCLSWTYSII